MRIIQIGVALACAVVSGSALADVAEEREQLRAAQAELNQLQLRLNVAEAAADPDARIRFRYDWLRRDLAIIRRGIQAQIDASTCSAKKKQRVRGDYRQ